MIQRKDSRGIPVLVDEETGDILATAFFKTPFNFDHYEEGIRTGLTCEDESLAQQHQKDEVDINKIVDRFLKTGLMPQLQLPARFGDYSDAPDRLEIETRIAESNAVFYNLAPEIRAKHQNNPQIWERDVMTALEQGNLAKIREMGIDVPEWRREEAQGGQSPAGGTPAPAGGNAAQGAAGEAPGGAKT